MTSWKEIEIDADNWQTKGEVGWELGTRHEVIQAILLEAVRMPKELGLNFLRTSGVESQLERIWIISRDHSKSDNNLFAADLALAIHKVGLARNLLTHSGIPLRPVWEAYRNALLALLDEKPFECPELKAKGFLATFLPHLKLAQSLSVGDETEPMLQEAQDAFRKRNASKRMHDPVGIDGDGHGPVQWDLRLNSILTAAAKTT